MQPIYLAKEILDTPRKIVITTHYKPDGDAMGASLGLYHYLKQLGHQVQVVSPSDVPDFLLWMPGMENVFNVEADTAKANQAMQNAEIIFCLDFNKADRIKHQAEMLTNSNAIKILIDHHLLPDATLFDYGISIPEKSSTCEMVADFILENGDEHLLTNEIMQCLYTGILTDTGSFRFPATGHNVHEIVALFKRKGLAHTPIHEAVFDTSSESRLRLLGFLLSQRMEILKEYPVALLWLSAADIKQFNAATGDTEGFVNQALGIEGIRVSILAIERNDEVKLSFRSKGNIDVSSFAMQYFNGGGHFNAAGGASKEALTNTLEKIKENISNLF